VTEVAHRRPPAPPESAAVRIDVAHTEAQARAAVRVLTRIWPQPDGHDPVTPELAWVFAHTGNYVALALVGDTVVGSAIGFRALDAAGPYLHSHIAGVVPEWQGSNIGFALKEHQRSWAIDAGLERVTWTFDPLVARNAYFNVSKLGARLTGYHVNFYGQMDDGINNGDETDRCVATWDLRASRVEAAARGEFDVPDIGALSGAGVPAVIRVGPAGEPVVSPRPDADALLLQLPVDVVAMRAADPGLGRAWRESLREVLVGAFADGFEVTGVSRDSWYVLARER
jgi:predicted GNAT superfamily acetyltransferase